MSPGVAERLAGVREAVAASAVRSGRDPAGVTIVAVSKTVDPEEILAAAACGQRDFGENRVREALVKYKEVSREDLRWHFVGRIQRNKVRQLLEFAHLIHSVDRIEVAREIDRHAPRPIPVCVQVNVSREPTKAGIPPGRLRAFLQEAAGFERVQVVGLTTVAPRNSDPEASRPFFRRLRELRDEVSRDLPGLAIHHLSMGMSQDYEVAVEEGATMVRIGEAIFGSRSLRQEGGIGATAPARAAPHLRG